MKYLLLIPALFAMNACGDKGKPSAPPPPANLHFQSDTLHFSMEYPGGWTKEYPRDSNKMVVFAEPLQDSADRFQENIQIWTETIPFPLPDSSYKLAAITQIRLANPGLQITRLNDLTVNAGTFSHFTFDFTTADSSRYTVHGYTLLKGPYGYNISITSEAEQKEKYANLMQPLLNTFQTLP